MSVEELRGRLAEAESDGADRAGIYDEVIEAYADAVKAMGEQSERVEKLTEQVTALTDTNMRLLDKIRYAEIEGEEEGEEKDPREMTFEELLRYE